MDNLKPITALQTVSDNGTMARWLDTGQFHVINVVNDSLLPRVEAVVAHFNPCSTLPLIQCHILGIEKTAIIDSGAARSLLSSTVAQQIWGENFHLTLLPW